ncbi:MAG: DNA cytosine methyltransferase [Oscillospiraceae bacterium]|nr:DNA cytosine methyltransferase [Oscillospiraceae bacterium]
MRLQIGGSPCTKWSIAQTKNRETEPAGIGWELFENYRIALEKFKPDFFLYENNKSMAPAIREQITRELGVEPILINSALVSAQNRWRLYWTNIPGVEQPEDRGILLRDILESGVCWREKAYTLDAHYYKTTGRYDPKKQRAYSRLMAAEPIRIGAIESDAKNADFDSQQYRVYSTDGKSVTICGQGGGVGAKTGLYAVPAGMAWRGRGESSSYEMRDDQKANAVIVGHQSRLVIEAADGRTYPVYEVRDGKIAIKGEQYPIRLSDGFYIIRKLTVRECMRLQTVPEDYIFPVSDTQAYKMLGNGWTVDVIAHILSYCPGITEEPLEVLSMYDGMSCGHLALDKLGAHVARYYATEIDKYAIKTTQANFPDTIQLGDAFQVREEGWALPCT